MEKKTKIVSLLVAACLILISILFVLKDRGQNNPVFVTADLSKHPVYSNYKYDKSGNVIYLGTQPLYAPTGLITETMKRDNLLRKNLLELGLKIRFYPFLKGADVNFFLQRGDLDSGIVGDMPAITIAATSKVLITSLIQYGPTSIMAKETVPIEHLKGRRIGYAFGSNAHYMLLEALSNAGIENQVTYVPLEVDQMPEALQAGEIEAFAAWEPIPEIGAVDHNFIAIYQKLSSGYLYFTKGFSERHPKALRQILASKIRAIEWLKGDQKNRLLASQWTIQASERLSGRKFGLDALENMRLSEKDILGKNSILTQEIPESDLKDQGPIHREFNFLKHIGMIPGSSQWRTVKESFTPQILNEILSDRNRYYLTVFDYSVGATGETET